MEVRHFINETPIDEPIGFDSIEFTLERQKHHGFSAESSVGKLEFYGEAYDLIKTAYNSDIDSVLIFKSEFKSGDNWITLYVGNIDLSTYEQQTGDYTSCSCNVAEIGVKTTFNNRTETKIDIRNGVMTDLDGVEQANETLSLDIAIQGKALQKSVIANSSDFTASSSEIEYDSSSYVASAYVRPFGYASVDELEGFIQGLSIADQEGSLENDFSFFVAPQTNAHYLITAQINLQAEPGGVNKPEDVTVLMTNGSAVVWNKTFAYPTTGVLEISENISLDLSLTQGARLTCHLLAFRTGGNGTVLFSVLPNNSVTIKTLLTAPASTASVILPFEAFKKVTSCISSDIEFRSSYYTHTINQIGAGALKGLVSGLRLRNSSLTNPNFILKTSFADLFKNLSCIDNIGFGFTVESDVVCLRVEHWKYFYQNEVIYLISNPTWIKRTFIPDNVYSALEIGYEKYSELEDLNTIDTFHTKRLFSNSLKAVDNTLLKVCQYIADPYAIEFTRVKSFDKTTENWRYDDNIFVIALRSIVDVPGPVRIYYTDMGITNSENIISPETLLNFRISPYKNACRFTDVIKQGNLTKEFKFISGTGNMSAKGKPGKELRYSYLSDFGSESITSENDNLTFENEPIIYPDFVEFEYPLSVSDYDKIKQQPYGVVTVNEEDMYLKKLTYSPAQGIGKFTCIPKR